MNLKPMLAVKADVDKVKFPVYVQPKLDGVRAVVKDGQVLSRTLKPIRNEHVQSLFGHLEGFDGELVVGSPKDEKVFQKSTSGVMTKEGQPEVTFYVFDKWDEDASYKERYDKINRYTPQEAVEFVQSSLVETAEGLVKANKDFLDMGYEGAIIRSPEGLYKFGRSTVNEGFLLKMKTFEDSEFKVVGFTEMLHNNNQATTNAVGLTERSSHKDNKEKSGKLGSLVVEYKDTTFEVGTGFTDSDRVEIFQNQDRYIGSMAKVAYQKSGMKDLPRFPSFKGFRDIDDMET